MIYRIDFTVPFSQEDLSSASYLTDIQEHNLTGYPIIQFRNTTIIINYNRDGFISGFEISNECTRTWDSEKNLISFTAEVLKDIETDIEVFDGSGYSEITGKDDFMENYSDYFGD